MKSALRFEMSMMPELNFDVKIVSLLLFSRFDATWLKRFLPNIFIYIYI